MLPFVAIVSLQDGFQLSGTGRRMKQNRLLNTEFEESAQ
jgi:hypothetical protein